MKVIVCTGIKGSERREFLSEVKQYAKERGRILEPIDVFDVIKRISPEPIDEATILNEPLQQRQERTQKAYKVIAQQIKDIRKQKWTDDSYAVVVLARAAFRTPGQTLREIPVRLVRSLKPDMYVTVVQGLKRLKANLDKDPDVTFRDLPLISMLTWRYDEIDETSKWAKPPDQPHYTVNREEPAETLYKLIFTPKAKKFYASFPITHASSREIQRARDFIALLRSKNCIVFDPLTIDDEDYLRELLQQRGVGQGILADSSEADVNALVTEVGSQTVFRDYKLIDQSDGLIVRYVGKKYLRYVKQTGQVVPDIHVALSAGVICEMVHGHRGRKRVYALWLLRDLLPSPFFRHHCYQNRIFCSEQELIRDLHRSRWLS